MSVEASKWAWGQKGLNHTEKLVLLCLADHADECGENCFPSQRRVADKTGVSRQSVIRAVHSMRERGLISTRPFIDMEPMRSVLIYRLNILGCDPVLQGVSHCVTGGVAQRYTKPSREPSREPCPPSPQQFSQTGKRKNEKIHEARTASMSWREYHWGSLERFVAMYNDLKPEEWRAVKTLSNGRAEKITSYLKQFPDQVWWERVFENCRKSQWCREYRNGGLDWLLQRGKNDQIENCVKVYDGKYR